MRRVIWSQRARRDLASIHTYIGEFNPAAASRVADEIVSAVESLGHYPYRGRPVAHGQRELAIVAPYLIRYEVRQDEVGIVTIRHGARRPM
jgi:toxin ParE1/3/4